MKLSRCALLGLVMSAIIASTLLPSGCSDEDNGAKPAGLTLADFEGSWVATQYKVTSQAAPQVFLELIMLGGTFTMEADDTGAFTGQAEIPEVLGGPLTLPFQGVFQLVTQDSIAATFNPEIPPFLTDFTAWFELEGNTLQLIDENTTFDFEPDGQEDPAIFEGTMQRQ
jgi:hypothetical protein